MVSKVDSAKLLHFLNAFLQYLENYRLELLRAYEARMEEFTFPRLVQCFVDICLFVRDANQIVRALTNGDSGLLNEEEFLGNWLRCAIEAHTQAQSRPGRRIKGENWLLCMDGILLKMTTERSDRFLQLAQDALTLRAYQYPRRAGHGRDQAERWRDFHRARKAAETTAKRLHRHLYKAEPDSLPFDWWLPVAERQGLMAKMNL
jgi:hypothetical protein